MMRDHGQGSDRSSSPRRIPWLLAPLLLASFMSAALGVILWIDTDGRFVPDHPAFWMFLLLLLAAAMMVSIIVRAVRRAQALAGAAGMEARIAAELQRAADEIRARDERLQQALAISQSIAFEWDPATDRITRSNECEVMLGLKAAELGLDTGAGYLQRVHPEDRDRFLATMRSLSPDSPAYQAKYRVVYPDGQVVVIEEAGRAYFDTQGRPLRVAGIARDVSRREKAEADAVRMQRDMAFEMDRLSALINSITDEVWFADTDGRFVLMNPSANQTFQLDPQGAVDIRALAGRLDVLRVDGTPRPIEEAPPLRALQGELVRDEEEIIRIPATGDWQYRQVSSSPVRNVRGEIIGSVTVVRDITAQRRNEAALRESEQKTRENAVRLARGQAAVDMINAMRDGIVLLKKDGTVISVNPAIEVITSLRASEIVGRDFRDLLPLFVSGNDLEVARSGLDAQLRGILRDQPPVSMRRVDGAMVRILPSMTFTDASGDGDRTAVLTLTDVTELYETERKYRELVQNANSIIMRLTPDHVVTFFNEYAQDFFGFSEGEVLGRSVLDTILAPVDSEGRDNRAMLSAITDQPERFAGNENENVCKDGRRVWIHWTNRAVRDAGGVLREILCVGADVTERRRIQTMNTHYQQRLRHLAEHITADEEQERWQISRYIHDAIVQNLSLASMRMGTLRRRIGEAGLGDEADALRATREMVNDAIADCRTVMSDLTPPLLYEMGLVPALSELAMELHAQHGIRVRVRAAGGFRDQPLDTALLGMLYQAVLELVMNAIKHAGPCSVRVAIIRSRNGVLIRVRDNGCGFDPSVMERNHGQDGGFGLFSIRERLKNMGGSLDVESDPGRGSLCMITLPA